VPITTADFKQPKPGPRAAGLVEQIIELPFDALFERCVSGAELTVGQVANADCLGRMDQRVTELDKPRRRVAPRRRGGRLPGSWFSVPTLKDRTNLPFDGRHG
jgi:hypothetical protein